MAKSPARRLKVFQAQFGFLDSVVAAPSQASALRAWGTHQDLFASGDARLATDEAAVKAALDLQRAVGTSDPFLLQASGLPKLPRSQAGASRKPGRAQASRPDPGAKQDRRP
jgi:hypothetical protein